METESVRCCCKSIRSCGIFVHTHFRDDFLAKITFQIMHNCFRLDTILFKLPLSLHVRIPLTQFSRMLGGKNVLICLMASS